MLSFTNVLLKIGRPTPKPVYNIHDPNGLRLLTRLRLGFSHLNEHKFNHNFKECVNPLCSCSLQVESVSHFLLHCHYFTDIRKTLFNELQSIDENILNQSNNETVELLLYGSNKFKFQQNCNILKSIKFIIKSERFSGSLIYENLAYTCIFCLFVYLFICSRNLKYIYKLPHTIPNQSGVYLGLIDNQFLYSFCFNNLIVFYHSTSGSVLVLFSFSYCNISYIFVCYTCSL